MEPASPLPETTSSWALEPSKRSNNAWRRTLGLFLLSVVVLLWTASSFLQSGVMADGQYSKPYFLTYINTSFFAIPLVPLYLGHLCRKYELSWLPAAWRSAAPAGTQYQRLSEQNSRTALVEHGDQFADSAFEYGPRPPHDTAEMSIRETLKLSTKFCGLWFLANWFNSSSFSNTSVASSTILTSTSSVFTLAFGTFAGTERFTVRKLVGVLASLAGIVLISTVDTRSDKSDKDLGTFPYKSPAQIALGDSMALLSACIYGLYATILTKTIGADTRVNMPLFFGFIGAFAALALWPGLPLLDVVGFEPFSLPPSPRVWLIIIANATLSLIADVSWAYAVLLTSPLVVTVGLTLTIPLSLVGQMFLNAQYSSPLYWVGAVVIVLSFVFVNYEEKRAPSEIKENQTRAGD